MAKLSLINRNLKRRKIVAKFAPQRAAFIDVMTDLKRTDEERADARKAFELMPRDASPVRLRNRCALTGRPRGVFIKFGLGRSKLREIAMRGEVPGMIKASW